MGGPSHDDEHPLADWLDFLQIQLTGISGDAGQARARLLKVAALSVAAIESLDRQAGKKAP